MEDNHIRKSRMELDGVYFWTNTIKGWNRVLASDKYKQIIVSSLEELVLRGKISVYAFVIMPNHLHMVWELHAMNGKELPNASFNKFTSHCIAKDLKINGPHQLEHFLVEEKDRRVRLWQRDPLAVLMDRKDKVEQKIAYIHLNPLQSHWNLAKTPSDYYWSSAAFYEKGGDAFGFITDYRERF